MGTVIRFPAEKRAVCHRGEVQDAPASIIILPVIRIERHAEDRRELLPAAKSARGRRRRRASDLERDAS